MWEVTSPMFPKRCARYFVQLPQTDIRLPQSIDALLTSISRVCFTLSTRYPQAGNIFALP